jgi:eukaryotic-like serine/threonine-protein kinase
VKSEIFGDYELLDRVAAGGMGEVFLARQMRGAGFERYVAIKRMLPDLSQDDELVAMFLDEARLASRLDHPNIVQIYDLGVCGRQYYLAMEFLEGRDLRRIMGRLTRQEQRLPIDIAAQIICDAAEGLHYAHELRDARGAPLNIIHRDVSPQNVFVTFHGTVKVLDFGIAKAQSRMARTRTGQMKGKVAYVSPEQAAGEPADLRGDVFALGVVLWEITIGKRLFRRDNDLLTLKAVHDCDVPRPTTLDEAYPTFLEAIVMRALARDPKARYPSCRALQDDLVQFMAASGFVDAPQKRGDWVGSLFEDEPKTVEELLERLHELPVSVSLLDGLADAKEPAGEFESSTVTLNVEDVMVIGPAGAAPAGPAAPAAAPPDAVHSVPTVPRGVPVPPATPLPRPLLEPPRTAVADSVTPDPAVARSVARRWPGGATLAVGASLALLAVAIGVRLSTCGDEDRRIVTSSAQVTPVPGERRAPAKAAPAPPVANAPAPRDDAPASIDIETVPGNLSIEVDGAEAGVSPTTLTLAPGERTLILRSRSRGIEHSLVLAVAPGERRREVIEVPLGSLALRITPYASVSVDGKRLGLTPLPPVYLYTGRHAVKLENAQLHKSLQRTVTIRAGKRTTLTLNLARDR